MSPRLARYRERDMYFYGKIASGLPCEFAALASSDFDFAARNHENQVAVCICS